ncbi:Serine/threonine protein kinase [Thermomonospora echinospora]|uniref:Serine/threonine protein kinase n=1 Tax=Thermomonospora echinospora TaxID=1992 RepID=A0A1H6CWA4_9ACTN|nr:serine/threonine-protein kinase [Thermomonospora echinospora]SEG76993.1 Serine/threonine protein kinase [Thermomonospora echinospora]
MDPLLPGDPSRVGDYELLGRLGAGGMGQVFYGRSRSGRPVAVKLIHPQHAGERRFRARFAREIRAAQRVSGFYTAPVVDADPEAPQPWMATAYIPGPSLRARVREHGPLSSREVRALGAGLAEGLAAIHTHDLVHRDLTPANVIMAADGPRIIDFGVARALDASAMTEIGGLLGTVAYMSPEQVHGQPAGPASDVFSLGSLLVFAATGRSPFDAATVPAIAQRVIAGAPDLGEIAGDLRDLIDGCLAKDPADRPTVDEILTRLTAPEPAAVHLAPGTGPNGHDKATVPDPPDRPTVPDVTERDAEPPSSNGNADADADAGEPARSPTPAPSATSDGGDNSAGTAIGLGGVAGVVLVIIVIVIGVGYTGTDIRLVYATGTRPATAKDDWPDQTLSWRIPAGGRIDTTWRVPPGSRVVGLDGYLGRRRSDVMPPEKCQGQVEWAISTDRTRIAGGVVTFDKRRVRSASLNRFKIKDRPGTVRLTARRIDRSPCAILLEWAGAGLDAPGRGPLWQ